ncbi:MAG: HAMP domain-containing sensor histidine kinase [Bacilli bacterium]
MRSVIGRKFFFTYCSFVIVFVAILYGANMVLLEPFYKWEKKQGLEKEIHVLSLMLEERRLDDLAEYAYKIQKSQNLAVDVFTDEFQLFYSTIFNQNIKGSGVQISDRITTDIQQHISLTRSILQKLVEDKELDYGQVVSFELADSAIDVSDIGYTYRLPTGGYVVVRTSMASIEDSISIFNKFLLSAAVILLLIGIILSVGVARWLGKPISRLAKMASRMKGKDFSSRWESGRKDEIGYLGDTMNELSNMMEVYIEDIENKNASITQELATKKRDEELKKAFISDVSHELKTPIALISGYAEGLRYGVGDVSDYVEVIIDETERMERLVSDLLMLSRYDAGQEVIDCQSFDMHTLIEKVAARFQTSYAFTDAKWETILQAKDAKVSADPLKIEHVINNYVTNALKYSDDQRRIVLSTYQKNNHFVVEVYNSGKPIPEEERALIWTSFYRLDKARNRNMGSTGLGLSIVQKMIALHNGKCGLYNTVDGVVFFFEIPISDE